MQLFRLQRANFRHLVEPRKRGNTVSSSISASASVL
jgi:hypothetical protein